MSTDKMEDDTGKSSYVIDSASESTVQTEIGTRKKAFIFHREKYIVESLAKALGYSNGDYTPFNDPEKLITQLNENPTLLLLSGDSPEGLKNILNEVFGGIKANKTPVLIFTLSNQKSLINANKNGFEELQECFDNKLVDSIQLPFTQINDIESKIKNLKNAYQNNHKQSAKMREKVAERRAEQQDVSQRHINKNLQAAQRILNGALRSGDYNLLNPAIEQKAIDCYTQLISAQPKDKEKEIEEAMITIDSAKNTLVSKPVKEEWHKNINKVLVVDDQKKMWEPVWEFIFGDKKVDVVEDGENGLDKIKNGGQYDCVLLDIDLGKDESGKDKENGIEVLQRIKHEQFDLPVIMMTAYDNAEITKAGLQYGATNYFVKEMVDISDRNSVDYYNKFKEIIGFLYYHKLQRKIWCDYKNIESKISSIDIMWSTFIGKHLKKAYFFLTLDSDFLLPKQLLLSQKRDNYSDVVLNIEFALYQISGVLYACNNNLSLDDAITNLIGRKKNIYGKIRYLTVIEIIEKSFKKKIGEADSLNEIFKRARHNRSKIRKDDAIALVELAIKYSGELVQILRINELDTPKKGFTKKEFTLNTNIRELRNSFLSHEEISVKGAEVLKKGFESSGSNVINSEILFIDDEGFKSAWYPVLNSIFDKVTVFERIENIPKEKNLNVYDLILLDLNLYPRDYNKGCKKGLETLSTIKEMNFTIPVIMLTATNSSYYTKKAFLKGAFDYFTKDTVLDPVSYWNQFNNIIQKALKIKNDEKELWEKFLNLTSLIERIKTSNTKLKNYLNNINESIYAPLKSAFFHYILISREHNLPEVYTIEILLTEENPKNDFLFLCGTAIEGLMTVLWRVLTTEQGKVPDAGFLVIKFSDRALSKNFSTIWEYRTISKRKSMNIDFKRHLATSLESVTKALTRDSSKPRYYFTETPNSGHENKKRTVSRNQSIRTASNKPRNSNNQSKAKKPKKIAEFKLSAFSPEDTAKLNDIKRKLEELKKLKKRKK